MIWNEEKKCYEQTPEEIEYRKNNPLKHNKMIIISHDNHSRIMHIKHELSLKNQDEVMTELLKHYDKSDII